MNNRLTVSTLACPDWSLETIVQRYADAGVAGIDFRGVQSTIDHSTLPAFTTHAHETLAFLAAHGLCVPCMCSSIKLMSPDAASWQTNLAEFDRYLAMSDAFNAPFIRIFPGATPKEMKRDEAAKMANDYAKQLVARATSFKVRPLLETHDDWGASTEVIKLLDGIPADDFGVIWDVRHTWAAKEDPADVIRTLGPRLKHVHVKDSVIVDGKERPGLLGEGVVSVGPALKALQAAGYKGWICLETEKRWYGDIAPEPEVSVPQFAKFVRAI